MTIPDQREPIIANANAELQRAREAQWLASLRRMVEIIGEARKREGV